MTCHSKKAPIYYINARIAFKKRKVISERLSWIVSIYDNPADIMQHDKKAMSRLKSEVYGKSSKSKGGDVIVREIISKQFLNYSNLSIDEHQRSNNTKV